jgi:hypothetical protein
MNAEISKYQNIVEDKEQVTSPFVAVSSEINTF